MAEYKDITELKKQIADFKKAVHSPNGDYLTGYLCALSATEGIIAGLSDADVVPVVHGRWLDNGMCSHKPSRFRNPDKWTIYKCSECGYSNGRRKNANYCPNCGAKMDGGDGMRDSLIKILRVPIFPHELVDPTEAVADYLLDNDVVPVVRCKECKHWHEEIGWCDKHSHFVDSDGVACHPWESSEWNMFDADYFCKDGERRNDGYKNTLKNEVEAKEDGKQKNT